MAKAAVVAAAMFFLVSAIPMGAYTLGAPESLESPTSRPPLSAAEPAKIIVVSDAPEPTPDFTEFFFHFNQMIIEWWKGGGRDEIRGRWQIFAREYARAGKRSDLAVVAVSDAGNSVTQEAKEAIQKSAADYFFAQREPRSSELIVVLSKFSERSVDVRTRIIPFSSGVELKRVGRVAASAIIQLLTVHTKGPAVPTPADKQSR